MKFTRIQNLKVISCLELDRWGKKSVTRFFKIYKLYHGDGLKLQFTEISNEIEDIFPTLANN